MLERKSRFVKMRRLRDLGFRFFILATFSLGLFYYQYEHQMLLEQNTKNIAYATTDSVEPVEKPVQEAVKEKKKKTKKNPIDFKALRETNKDVIAWLKIDDTVVDYPVMCSNINTDVDFYLSHTWEKNEDIHGSVYMRRTNNINFDNQFSIIYGHNMRDGSMFGCLSQFTADSKNKIRVYTPNALYTYVIEGIDVSDDTLKTLDSVKETLGSSFKEDANYLALSTCTSNSTVRRVIYARQIKTFLY